MLVCQDATRVVTGFKRYFHLTELFFFFFALFSMLTLLDIKLNVAMDYQGMSMIVEIQFLLKFMGESKNRIHHLYEITRSNEFINEMVNITSIARDKQEQLLFLIHSSKDDAIAQLARFLVSYRDEVDLGQIDKMGLNAFHYVCKLGKMKMLKLLFDVTTYHELKKYMNLPAGIRLVMCVDCFTRWEFGMTWCFVFFC